MSQLIPLKDYSKKGQPTYGWLNNSDGCLYQDEGGGTLLRRLRETEFLLGDNHQPIIDHGERIHISRLANAAAEHYYGQAARLTGKAVQVAQLDEIGRLAYDKDGQLITMDLAPSDVHQNAALSNYAAGYHIADGVADAIAPVILVPHATNVYFTWNVQNDFNRKFPSGGAAGGAPTMVNPAITPATYTTLNYALGGVMPVEVQTNADTPLQPFTKLTQMVVDGLRLEREYRVATMLQTSANWNASLVTTLLSGSQWDGGAASDPVAVIHAMEEASYLDLDCLVWSTRVKHDIVRNPALQKFIQFKDRTPGIPMMAQLTNELGIPDIYEAKMKYTVGGALTYVWGNHVVGIHRPKTNPPTDQMDVATAYTFRWNGGTAPDGTMTGGLLVRSYWDPKIGPRGSTVVTVTHNDAEVMTSGLVGGLVLNAHQ